MEYSYVAYTKDRRLVKGKLSAVDEAAAASLLNYGGYQVLSLKQVVPFFDTGGLGARFARVKSTEIVMFSRQLALLLESGTDIVTSLELLQNQTTNHTLKKVIADVVNDIRGGSSLSAALSKHPRAFSQLYYRAVSAGEQGGNLEETLRQMANHLERAVVTEKKIKSALRYPIIVFVIAIAVVGLLVTFVLPRFTSLYAAFGADLPTLPRMLIGMTDWFNQYGLWLVLGIVAAVGVTFFYIRTPAGKVWWHRTLLSLPLFGRINLLNELSRCCRTMALLFKVGVPLPEIMAVAIYGSTNKIVAEALTEVQQELIKGEGLSRPMSKNKLFLPLMVQMVGVGEETGNLDKTLTTVAQAYEAEAEDKTSAAVATIQPVMTLVIGGVVAFIAIALVQAMYSVYGHFG
jgi:type IV pilus assembly protein PilC